MIVIMGIGGSGTRLYGKIINNMGIDLGRKINMAFDNLETFNATNYYDIIKKNLLLKVMTNSRKYLRNKLVKVIKTKKLFVLKNQIFIF